MQCPWPRHGRKPRRAPAVSAPLCVLCRVRIRPLAQPTVVGTKYQGDGAREPGVEDGCLGSGLADSVGHGQEPMHAHVPGLRVQSHGVIWVQMEGWWENEAPGGGGSLEGPGGTLGPLPFQQQFVMQSARRMAR